MVSARSGRLVQVVLGPGGEHQVDRPAVGGLGRGLDPGRGQVGVVDRGVLAAAEILDRAPGQPGRDGQPHGLGHAGRARRRSRSRGRRSPAASVAATIRAAWARASSRVTCPSAGRASPRTRCWSWPGPRSPWRPAAPPTPRPTGWAGAAAARHGAGPGTAWPARPGRSSSAPGPGRRAQDGPWKRRCRSWTAPASSGAGPSTVRPGTTSRIGSVRTGGGGTPSSASQPASCSEEVA